MRNGSKRFTTRWQKALWKSWKRSLRSFLTSVPALILSGVYVSTYVPLSERLVWRTECEVRKDLSSLYDDLCRTLVMETLVKICLRHVRFQITIVEDYDREDNDPMGHEKGFTVYEKSEIIVFDQDNEDEMLRVIAHEITHLALHYVYRNYGRPYNERKETQALKETISKISRTSCSSDLNCVFSCYHESEWESEIIAFMVASYVVEKLHHSRLENFYANLQPFIKKFEEDHWNLVLRFIGFVLGP